MGSNDIPLKEFVDLAYRIGMLVFLITITAMLVHTFYIIPNNAYYVGDYKFYLLDHISSKNESRNVIGQTKGQGTILIRKDLTKKDFGETCSHEICHNILRGENLTQEQEEYVCRNLDRYLHFAECDELMNRSGRG